MSEEADKTEDTSPAEADASDSSGDSDEPLACDGDEYVMPGPTLPNGNRLILHHHADHTYTPGVMRLNRDGVPLSDETILVEPREGTPYYNVVGTVAEMKKGPSKVNSPAFKRGWDNVFGNKPKADLN